jgi:hypothetical protein
MIDPKIVKIANRVLNQMFDNPKGRYVSVAMDYLQEFREQVLDYMDKTIPADSALALHFVSLADSWYRTGKLTLMNENDELPKPTGWPIPNSSTSNAQLSDDIRRLELAVATLSWKIDQVLAALSPRS